MQHQKLLTVEGGYLHLAAATLSDLDQLQLTLIYENPGLVVRRIRCGRARTWPGLFDEMAAALQFPSYFGANWSAALDCLRTMESAPGAGYVLLFADAGWLLDNEPASALHDFVDLVATVHDDWRLQGRPFHVLLQSAAADDLAARLIAAGADVDRDWTPDELRRPPQPPA